MKIVSVLKKMAKKSTVLRILMRNGMYTMKKIRFRMNGNNIQIDDKLMIFGAYNGKSYACSPKAVYEYMVRNEKYRDYQFVWFFDNPENYEFLKSNRNTIVVKKGSSECEKYLHKAKYWIFNFRAMDHWIPSKNQIYVQCWHGTPLKRLGYDITNSDNAMNSVSEIKSKYRTDAQRFNYMVSPCDFVTEKFTSAWNLQAVGKQEAVLEIGYPRNDFLKKCTREDVISIKKKLGLNESGKKIILYAPTWRDNQHDAEKGYVYRNPVDFDYLRDMLGEEYIILFRAHYLVADQFDFKAYEGFIYNVSAHDDINELYIISDILITDYSSVFFDYAILERPMLFYMYDMEEYRDEMRGFYLDIKELPGPVIKTEKELVEALNAFTEIDENYQKEISHFNAEYNRMNDGNASERLVNYLLNN